MQFEFDAAKDVANIDKHGVSLSFARIVFENQIGSIKDDRKDYGEVRFNAFARINNRLFVCTYTMRGNIYRIISVRKAGRQEQRPWQL